MITAVLALEPGESSAWTIRRALRSVLNHKSFYLYSGFTLTLSENAGVAFPILMLTVPHLNGAIPDYRLTLLSVSEGTSSHLLLTDGFFTTFDQLLSPDPEPGTSCKS